MLTTRVKFKIEKRVAALLGTSALEVQDSRLLHIEDDYTLLMIKVNGVWIDVTIENEKTSRETVEVVISA